jgi:ubiquinone/menaquinone biosynthesis C-methylase UbiE
MVKQSQVRQDFYNGRVSQRAREMDRFYHTLLKQHYHFLVPPGLRVLELGCGLGDVLAAVCPSRGVGVDFSQGMIELARQRHPRLQFETASALEYESGEIFDYIILSDLVNDLDDVQSVLAHARRFAHHRTRLVLNFFNNVWRPVLGFAESIGAKAPSPPQNWLATADMRNLLYLAGWEVIKSEPRILWPQKTPLLARFFNQCLAPFAPWCCLTVFMVARPKPRPSAKDLSCSVIIPARNESGNIAAAVERLPRMGSHTEIIFIEGHSQDDTWQEIQRVAACHPNLDIKVLKQTSKGKGGAVREAFSVARGDVLMILDADLTMPPEHLPKYFDLIHSGLAEFVNGVRLVYPMEKEAMRFLNMVANKGFSLAFSWILGQSIKDTLCGTKVLLRTDYELIARNRSFFGDFDPFGDFDLLFGAAKLNLKIVDLPIRYQARTFGDTNIQRWRHGWLLCRMAAFAARRLKFAS